MSSGEVRLAVDCGGAGVVAVLVWPDGRWLPLAFDGGAPLLSAGVWVAPDGVLLTGGQAWQQASLVPERFVPAPLRLGADRRHPQTMNHTDQPAPTLYCAQDR